MEATKKKKRSVLSTKSPAEELLLEQFKRMPAKYGSYASFLYLIGSRCREPLGLPKKDVTPYKEIKNNKLVWKGYDINDWIIQPLIRSDITIDDDFLNIKELVVFKRFNDKKKTQRLYMNKYADLTDEQDEKFFTILWDYIATLPPHQPIWTFNRFQAYYMIRKHTGLFPHKLRSMRITKDIRVFELNNIIELKNKHGMESPRTPEKYFELDDADTKKKMRQRRIRE